MHLSDEARTVVTKFIGGLGCAAMNFGVFIAGALALLAVSCSIFQIRMETDAEKQSLSEAQRKEREEARNRIVRQFAKPMHESAINDLREHGPEIQSIQLVSSLAFSNPVTRTTGLGVAGSLVLYDASIRRAIRQEEKRFPDLIDRILAILSPLSLFNPPALSGAPQH